MVSASVSGFYIASAYFPFVEHFGNILRSFVFSACFSVELAIWTHYVATELKPELLEGLPTGSHLVTTSSSTTITTITTAEAPPASTTTTTTGDDDEQPEQDDDKSAVVAVVATNGSTPTSDESNLDEPATVAATVEAAVAAAPAVDAVIAPANGNGKLISIFPIPINL